MPGGYNSTYCTCDKVTGFLHARPAQCRQIEPQDIGVWFQRRTPWSMSERLDMPTGVRRRCSPSPPCGLPARQPRPELEEQGRPKISVKILHREPRSRTAVLVQGSSLARTHDLGGGSRSRPWPRPFGSMCGVPTRTASRLPPASRKYHCTSMSICMIVPLPPPKTNPRPGSHPWPSPFGDNGLHSADLT